MKSIFGSVIALVMNEKWVPYDHNDEYLMD